MQQAELSIRIAIRKRSRIFIAINKEKDDFFIAIQQKLL